MADVSLLQSDFQAVLASTLVTASPAVDVLQQQVLDLQTQVADLQTRVAALEAAVPPA